MMTMSLEDDREGSGARFRSEREDLCGKLSDDFVGKLKIDGAGEGFVQREPESGDSRDSFESAVSDQGHEEEEEGDDGEEFEFSFACVNPDGSPASADDVFQDGQIRTAYPLFDRSLLLSETQDEAPGTTGEAAAAAPIPRPPLKKLFFEMAEGDDLDGLAEGTYCVWNGKTVEEAAAEGCRKSNSTGFSKLWRFRDLVHRSSSDGKDAFVFLNPHRAARGKIQEAKKDEPGREKAGRTAVSREGKMRSTVTVTAKGQQTAHEKHYVRNRAARESDRRKSFLPYRQDLVGVGFFTNVTGMTRNVHPF